ncbi:PCC domain-containing protein [Sphingobium ummariense]
MSGARRYIATPTGYLMVLREGGDLIACLEAITQAEDIPSASILGFGFVEKARFGFFNHEKDAYAPGGGTGSRSPI